MKRDTTHSWTDPRLAQPTSYQRELLMGLLLVVLGLGGLFRHGIDYRTQATLPDVGPSQRGGGDEEDSDTAAAGSMLLVGGVFLIVVGAKRS
jgi:hypothetical protein